MRFTTRRLMGVVVLVAVILATILGSWRWVGRIKKSQFHAAQAMGFLTEAAEHGQRAYDEAVNNGDRGRAKAWLDSLDYNALGSYHAGLATKYNRAVWRFWEPVAPDGAPPVFQR